MKPGHASEEQIAAEIKAHGRQLQAHERIHNDTESRLRRIGRLLLVTDDGKLLLKELEEMYHRKPKKGADPYETYLNLGREDVVLFLQGLRDEANGE